MRILFKLNWIILLCLAALVGAAGVYLLNSRLDFQSTDVTSSIPFRSDWEVPAPNFHEAALLSAIVSQPLTYLGEGGQSVAFSSGDGLYVLKLFKFNRFRPSPFFSSLPAFAPFSSYYHRHAERRLQKLEKAFAGYKLAYDLHRNESGLLLVQLNALPEPLLVTIKGKSGQETVIDLQNVPFIVQLKGEMLGDTLHNLLKNGELKAAQNLLDELFGFYVSEYAKGLRDLDRGLMHNIGTLDGVGLFHLDVGKIAHDEQMKQPERQQQELLQMTQKVDQWLQRHAPEHAPKLKQHMQMRLPGVSNASQA